MSERKSELERDGFSILGFTPQMPTIAGLTNPKSGVQNSFQVTTGLKHLNHHPLPPGMHTSRKLGSEAEPGFEPRFSSMGCRHLTHCAKHTPKVAVWNGVIPSAFWPWYFWLAIVEKKWAPPKSQGLNKTHLVGNCCFLDCESSFGFLTSFIETSMMWNKLHIVKCVFPNYWCVYPLGTSSPRQDNGRIHNPREVSLCSL